MNIKKKSKIRCCLDEFEEKLNEIKKNIGKRVMSNQEINNFITELRILEKETLEKIFGKEQDITDPGWMSDLPYKNIKDAVHTAYWSTVQTGKGNKRFRDYLFYKGPRWSDDILKDQFYKIFKMLKSVFGEDCVPVNFLVSRIQGNFLMISSAGASENKHLVIPDLRNVSRIKKFNALAKDIKGIASKLWELKKINQKDDFKTVYNNSVESDVRKLQNKLKVVLNKLKTNNKSHDYLLNCFRNTKCIEVTNNDYEAIFKVMCLYQYYDCPYFIYIFLPDKNRSNDHNFALCISRKNSADDFINENKTIMQNITNSISGIVPVKDKILKKYHKQIPIMYWWRVEFEKRRKLYERWAKLLKIQIEAICEKNRILGVVVIDRYKDFDSFYNKIAKRANGDDKDYKDKDKIKNLYDKIINLNFKEVFHEIHDVMGIRVTCYFKEDIRKLITILVKDGDLCITKPKCLHESYYAGHITVKPGKTRMNFLEYEDLEGIQCEVQIRSLISGTSAELQHDITYKSPIPEKILSKDKKFATIEAILRCISGTLKAQDDGFSKIRDDLLGLIEAYAPSLYIED